MKQFIYLVGFTVIAFISSIQSEAQYISTLAGTVASGYSGDGGQATAAELFHPKGAATDNAGNVYIADADNNVIRMVTPAGVISTFAGIAAGGFGGDGGPASSALLNRPNCIVIDPAGNFFICDADNQRVRKINTAGIISTIAGDGTAAFLGDGGPATAAEINYPGGIALDKHGNLYITDEYNNRIRKIDPAGIITTFAGNGSTGYPGDAELADTAAIGFPFGIATDTFDNVYFSLTLDNRICKVDPSHILTSIAGIGGGTGGFGGDGGPATAAQFDNPWGIAVDNIGNLYIADNANERIRKVNLSSGIITTMAGNGSGGFAGDGGLAISAKLKDPAGVSVDVLGNVYIADYNNHRIRKVNGSPSLGVSTIPDNQSRARVFPNPNGGTFTVNMPSVNEEQVSIIIADVNGRIVKEFNDDTNKNIELHLDMNEGIYFLKAVTNSNVSEQAFTIENKK